MSNDTDYKLVFKHDDIAYLKKVLEYLEQKKERWDTAKAEGKSSSDLMKELGLKSPNEVVFHSVLLM
jgi:hypothetical protein